MTDFIRIHNLHKTYELGHTEVHALRGITLRIPAGERVVLGGPSGSGKSTLLHTVGCLDRVTRGEVRVADCDVTTANDNALTDFRRRYIGFVFQNFNLLPVLTTYENVEYPLVLNREKNSRARVMTMLEAVGLGSCANNFPNELSGGQQQRVAIARALIHGPRLLIADEPTANLDSATGEAIIHLMLDLSRAQGATVIICTHNEGLLRHAERRVMLRDGGVESDVRRDKRQDEKPVQRLHAELASGSGGLAYANA